MVRIIEGISQQISEKRRKILTGALFQQRRYFRAVESLVPLIKIDDVVRRRAFWKSAQDRPGGFELAPIFLNWLCDRFLRKTFLPIFKGLFGFGGVLDLAIFEPGFCFSLLLLIFWVQMLLPVDAQVNRLRNMIKARQDIQVCLCAVRACSNQAGPLRGRPLDNKVFRLASGLLANLANDLNHGIFIGKYPRLVESAEEEHRFVLPRVHTYLNLPAVTIAPANQFFGLRRVFDPELFGIPLDLFIQPDGKVTE